MAMESAIARDSDHSPSRDNRLLDWLWLLAWGGLASLYCVIAGQKLGATFDEPFYMTAGMDHWRTGSYEQLLRAGTMPLPVDVQTLPLYLYERWNSVTLDVDRDLDVILPYARLGTLAFLWLLLIYARLIGRAAGGPWAGRLAVALLAIEPSFLGHSSLATTDIAITACMLPLLYHYWRNRESERWVWRVGLPAICFGFALLAKASALVFGPVCMLVIECRRLAPKGVFHLEGAPSLWARVRHSCGVLRPWFRQMWAIGFLALVVVLIYCGSDWKAEASFVAWANKLPEGAFKDIMLTTAENLCIFPNAGGGLMRQIRHNMQGHAAYLIGIDGQRSIWFYFPVLLTIKLTLPLFLLTGLVLLVRQRALLNWPFLCFLALFAFSLTFRVQIGIRMVLPMVALGIIGLAAGLTEAFQGFAHSWKRVTLGMTTLGCLAWTTAVTSRQHPHGICYANELWGGTRAAYTAISDANYDWGQGLKELRRWQERHGVADMSVWYFGADPLLKYLPMRSAPFSLWKVKSDEEFRDKVRGRILAVSTTNLYGSYAPDAEVPQRILRALKPAARTQTFLIYDFRDTAQTASR